jgi:hypothetical protein
MGCRRRGAGRVAPFYLFYRAGRKTVTVAAGARVNFRGQEIGRKARANRFLSIVERLR